jgi:hypothetical protein
MTGNWVSAEIIPSPIPMSAQMTSPQCWRPGKRTCAGFFLKKVTHNAAVQGCEPSMNAAVSPLIPLGTSTATTGTSATAMSSNSWESSGDSPRDRPAPKIASTTSPALMISPGTKGRATPFQAAAIFLASSLPLPCSPIMSTSTSKPRASRCRATTYPSPPLLPGPHSTSVRMAGHLFAISLATCRPAFSIRLSKGVPPRADSRSTSACWETVRISGPGCHMLIDRMPVSSQRDARVAVAATARARSSPEVRVRRLRVSRQFAGQQAGPPA